MIEKGLASLKIADVAETSETEALVENSTTPIEPKPLPFKICLLEIQPDLFRVGYHTSDDTEFSLEYKKTEKGCVVKYLENKEDTVFDGENHIEKGVADFVEVVKDPKCGISVFHLDFDNEEKYTKDQYKLDCSILFLSLKLHFSQLPHQLHILGFFSYIGLNQFQYVTLLNFMKAGSLSTLCLDNKMEAVEKILETEQWQKAENACLEDVGNVPIEKFLHLKRCRLGKYPLTNEDVSKIVKKLVSSKGDFESIRFRSQEMDFTEIHRYVKANFGNRFCKTKLLMIPECEDWLELICEPGRLTFAKYTPLYLSDVNMMKEIGKFFWYMLCTYVFCRPPVEEEH